MKRKVIITEEKMVKVESPSWYLSGHGYCEKIPKVDYFDEPFISEEHSKMLLEKANKIYKEKGYESRWIKEPVLSVYWEVLKEEVENL